MEICRDNAAQANSSPCDAGDGGGALRRPDDEVIFAYYDLADRAFSKGEHGLALDIMKIACASYRSCALFHYWFAGIAYKIYDHRRSGGDLSLQEVLQHYAFIVEAACKATIESPREIEFIRFHANVLGKASLDRVLSIPKHLQNFKTVPEKIQEMRKHRENMKVTQLYKIDVNRRSNQISRREFVPETEQKRLDPSCWDRMSTEKQVEFLGMKYDDIRAFFVDGNDEEALAIFLDVLGRAVTQGFRFWHCKTCKMDFKDWESHRQHVWRQHICSLPQDLQTMLPKEGPSTTNLPQGNAKELLLSFDSTKLMLHLCHSTLAEASSELGFLECSVPDLRTLLFWLYMDEYDHNGVEKKQRQEGDILRLLKSNYGDLKEIYEGFIQENLGVAQGKPSNAIETATQFEVTSELLQNERALGEDTIQLHQELVETGAPPNIAGFIYREIRKKIADYECELTRACCVDHGTRLLPYLKSFLKLRFTNLFCAYSTELKKNEANKSPSEGSSPSKQIDNSSSGKNELTPSDFGDGDVLSNIVHKNGISSQKYSESELEAADLASIRINHIGSELEANMEPVPPNRSRLTESGNRSTPQTMLNTQDEMHQCHLSTAVILALWHLELFRDELSMKISLHNHVGATCVVCELHRVFIALGKKTVEERFVNTTLEEFNCIKLVGASSFLQKEHYSASDVLAAILDCLHASFSSSGDPVANLVTNYSRLGLCQSETCVVHKLFGMTISEVVEISVVNATNENFKLLHSVGTEELCSTKITHPGDSFEELLKTVALNHQYAQVQENYKSVCQRISDSSEHIKLYQTLSICPHIFAVVLEWQTNSSNDDISKILSVISDELDLSALYDGLEQGSKYILQSMISCSVDYACFIHDFKHKKWIFSSKDKVEEISSWCAVVTGCELASFRPEVLLYVLKE